MIYTNETLHRYLSHSLHPVAQVHTSRARTYGAVKIKLLNFQWLHISTGLDRLAGRAVALPAFFIHSFPSWIALEGSIKFSELMWIKYLISLVKMQRDILETRLFSVHFLCSHMTTATLSWIPQSCSNSSSKTNRWWSCSPTQTRRATSCSGQFVYTFERLCLVFAFFSVHC